MPGFKVIDQSSITWYNEKEEIHREDGPAVERVNGDNEYWLNGKQLTEEEFKKLTLIEE